jgi:Outer membrane protein beta-barrel domain
MKKIILVITVATISALTARAQEGADKTAKFSAGVEAGFPVGTVGIGSLYSFAIGGSLEGEYYLSPDFGVTLKAGYIHYLIKGGGPGDGFVPVLAGFRYHFTSQVYLAGQLGISFSTISRGGSGFTYSPGIGLQLSKHADVLGRYEATYNSGLNIGNLGVRLAYDF